MLDRAEQHLDPLSAESLGCRLDHPTAMNLRVVEDNERPRPNVEVDLVCEADDGRIAGVEVKATSRVEDRELNGLRSLRDKLGQDFMGGVVLYLGDRAYTREDRIHVLPMDRVWM